MLGNCGAMVRLQTVTGASRSMLWLLLPSELFSALHSMVRATRLYQTRTNGSWPFDFD